MTGEAGTLIGNIFSSQEEFESWFNFACSFAGSQWVMMPEGSSHVDLEELASCVAHTEHSSMNEPSSVFTPCGSSSLLTSLVLLITVQQPDAKVSPTIPQEE